MNKPELDGNVGFGISGKPDFSGLKKYFVFPPFSVMRAMEGEWMRRKRAWLSLGIKSEVGRCDAPREGIAPDGVDTRDADRAYADSGKKKASYGKVFAIGDKATWEQGKRKGACRPHLGNDPRPGREPGQYEGGDAWVASGDATGTSIFDPVLCELIYRWFCVKGGQVLDPFAGGSVRGVVAHVLGLKYRGIELRPEQVVANEKQAEQIIPEDKPTWLCGDAREVLVDAPEADLIFSCPPYGNLELYSELPGDLSNMEYPEFRSALLDVVKKSVDRLRDNRFACFVVGNFRDKQGFYHDFVGDTVRCFQKAGMGFYNEIILVTAAGSLPIRVTKQFQAGRKIGKTHQNILVFYKGDPKRIKEEFGPVVRE